jgi:signal transduction histidine kinase
VANSPEKMDKYTKTIYSNAVDMDHLIDELFLFSKLDLNQISFGFEPINIEEYLKDCVEDKAYDLEQKGIKLEYEPHLAGDRTVIGDRLRLQRVINNILQNAEQHRNPDNGEPFIKISAADHDGEVVIKIKDNGKGITKESLPYIFDRLYRADPSRNRQIKGSGLGLSIAKHIVEAHGGRIWAESTEGEGASICFTLRKAGTDNVNEEAGA